MYRIHSEYTSVLIKLFETVMSATLLRKISAKQTKIREGTTHATRCMKMSRTQYPRLQVTIKIIDGTNTHCCRRHSLKKMRAEEWESTNESGSGEYAFVFLRIRLLYQDVCECKICPGSSTCKKKLKQKKRAEPSSTEHPQHIQTSGRICFCKYPLVVLAQKGIDFRATRQVSMLGLLIQNFPRCS